MPRPQPGPGLEICLPAWAAFSPSDFSSSFHSTVIRHPRGNKTASGGRVPKTLVISPSAFSPSPAIGGGGRRQLQGGGAAASATSLRPVQPSFLPPLVLCSSPAPSEMQSLMATGEKWWRCCKPPRRRVRSPKAERVAVEQRCSEPACTALGLGSPPTRRR